VNYTVTYNANGGTGAPSDPNSPYQAGITVTVLGQGGTANAGFTFDGWNTQSDGLGTDYAGGATFPMPAYNVTLYAQWSENTKYNVTYDLNGGTSGSQTDGSSPYFEGVEVTVLDENDMVKTNYHFTGWKNGGGTDYAAGDKFNMPPSNVILYAQWVADEVCAKVTLAADWNYAYRHCTNELLYWWAYCGAGRCDPPAKIRDHLPIIVTIVEGSKILDNGTITLKIDTAKLEVETGPTPDGSGNIVLTINASGTGVVEELIVKKTGNLESNGTQDWTDITNITVAVEGLKDATGGSACFTSNTLSIDGDNDSID
jgi:uncharacterized repeat protein (TIGR02543 family)